MLNDTFIVELTDAPLAQLLLLLSLEILQHDLWNAIHDKSLEVIK